MKKYWKWIESIVYVIASIGLINWGLIGLFNFNLLQQIFGSNPVLITTLYIIVGFTGIYIPIRYFVKK